MNETTISELLNSGEAREGTLEKILRETLRRFHSETGTIHLLDAQKATLHLAAQIGLPAQMLEVVKTIPAGKGIAGQVAAQNKPVSICNLQTDNTGVAKPGAKQTGVTGALCVPIRHGNELVGTLGVGTVRQYEYTAAETAELEEIGRQIGQYVEG